MVWTIATASGTTTITPDGTSSADLDTLLDTAIALNELQVIKDRVELELAGGYRVVAIALNMAKDTDSEGILKEFLDGALKQLETEV
jgi:ABC-type enterochelin transport system ATPase subunit